MTYVIPGSPPVLIRTDRDRKHRPLSHPLLGGIAHLTPEPLSGWRIRALRIHKGMSQYDLADLIEVSRPAVAQWESGANRPSSEHMARLREMLL